MRPVNVVFVTATGCHLCDEGAKVLSDLAERHHLSIDFVPMTSETGRELVSLYRVPFPPILIVDGAFFGYGRISRRKLEERLAHLETVG
jgi:thiol-disulfide isomerase/thioredoxin